MGQRGFILLVFRSYLFSKRSEKNGDVGHVSVENCLLNNEDKVVDFNNDHNHVAPTHIIIESIRIKKE